VNPQHLPAMETIEYKTFDPTPDARFSILIPTWNNLEYLQFCLRSIQKNSRFPHQVILHINEGADGTREWAERERLDYSYSSENVGICFAMNAAASLAQTEYLVYINDDMYVAPDWDFYLWQEIERLDHIYYLLGSALIEPRGGSNTNVTVCADFGDSPGSFQEAAFLEQISQLLSRPDWCGAGGAGVLVHKKIWDLVGGYSVEFSPGLYSDPDFSMKLWQAGVRHFKGLAASRIFHFQAKSTGRIVKRNDGRKQFARKWKLPASQFIKDYLRLTAPFKGPLNEPEETLSLKFARWRSRWI
jgi:glycosyltransferase involved in cell wall biosynthesis